jgi:hypothetical protein
VSPPNGNHKEPLGTANVKQPAAVENGHPAKSPKAKAPAPPLSKETEPKPTSVKVEPDTKQLPANKENTLNRSNEKEQVAPISTSTTHANPEHEIKTVADIKNSSAVDAKVSESSHDSHRHSTFNLTVPIGEVTVSADHSTILETSQDPLLTNKLHEISHVSIVTVDTDDCKTSVEPILLSNASTASHDLIENDKKRSEAFSTHTNSGSSQRNLVQSIVSTESTSFEHFDDRNLSANSSQSNSITRSERISSMSASIDSAPNISISSATIHSEPSSEQLVAITAFQSDSVQLKSYAEATAGQLIVDNRTDEQLLEEKHLHEDLNSYSIGSSYDSTIGSTNNRSIKLEELVSSSRSSVAASTEPNVPSSNGKVLDRLTRSDQSALGRLQHLNRVPSNTDSCSSIESTTANLQRSQFGQLSTERSSQIASTVIPEDPMAGVRMRKAKQVERVSFSFFFATETKV